MRLDFSVTVQSTGDLRVTGDLSDARKLKLAGVPDNMIASLKFAENKLAQRVIRRVHEKIVRGTPVDTGEARSNWVVTIGAEWNNQLPPYYPGVRLGINERRNARAAINLGRATIEKRKTGDVVFITNNVHYIGLLNSGWSRQAPVDFVDAAIIAGVVSSGASITRTS